MPTNTVSISRETILASVKRQGFLVGHVETNGGRQKLVISDEENFVTIHSQRLNICLRDDGTLATEESKIWASPRDRQWIYFRPLTLPGSQLPAGDLRCIGEYFYSSELEELIVNFVKQEVEA